jgi:hypothetical protein
MQWRESDGAWSLTVSDSDPDTQCALLKSSDAHEAIDGEANLNGFRELTNHSAPLAGTSSLSISSKNIITNAFDDSISSLSIPLLLLGCESPGVAGFSGIPYI